MHFGSVFQIKSKVYDSPEACLSVEKLSAYQSGKIALWVGRVLMAVCEFDPYASKDAVKGGARIFFGVQAVSQDSSISTI